MKVDNLMSTELLEIVEQVLDAVKESECPHECGVKVADILIEYELYDPEEMGGDKMPKWMKPNNRPKSQTFTCSECFGSVQYIDSDSRKKFGKKPSVCRYAYCPHCGAKMDGMREAVSYNVLVVEKAMGVER